MPYVNNETISQKPLTGGVEITDEQYAQARQAKLDGKEIRIIDDGLVIASDTTKTVYSTVDGSEKVQPDNFPFDDGFTDIVRPSEFHKWLGGKWVRDEDEYLKAKEAELDAAIQQTLEDFAATRGYTTFDRLCTYVTSIDTQFAAEAARGIELRDATWKAAGVILNDVLAGNRPVPESYDDIKDELPELTWGDL